MLTIVFVVVALAMGLVMVFSLLVLVPFPERPLGILALPYHLTYGIIFIKVMVVFIIIFVVVIRALDSIVVFSVLMVCILLVIHAGILAPLYHLNQ